MELNAEQIKMALEYCITNDLCNNCPVGVSNCHITEDALALIKELTEENVELARTCAALTRKVQVSDEQYDSLLDRNVELGGEVDGLKAHLDISVAEQIRLADEVEDWKAIAEGYQKQFEDCAEDRARLTEENERLMIECENQGTLWRQHFESIYETAKETVRADIVREMWDRLKYTLCINNEENTEFFDYAYTLETIDQIAQEMLEGK